jgi:SanA protein
MKTFAKIIFSLFVIACLVIAGVIVSVRTEYKDRVYNEIQNVSENSVVVVLGASINRDMTPSDVLEDRLQVAVDLWEQGKAEKIILSGDDGRWAQPEIPAMVNYMYSQGVPDDILIPDGDNARTYDSCYRLKNELNQDKVILITQGFHLPRALYLCNKLGLDAQGIKSDLRPYRKVAWFTVRDWLASFFAFWDINAGRTPSYLE